MKIKNSLMTLLLGAALTMGAVADASAQAKKNIALLLYSHGFEFMVALDQGARTEAKKLGVDLTVLDGQSNSEVQTRQIEDLLVKGVDAIIISPNNSNEIVPGVRRANDAKVPVVALDAIVGEGANIVTYVGFNNAEGGKVAAKYLVDKGGVKEALELQGALGPPRPEARERLRSGCDGI